MFKEYKLRQPSVYSERFVLYSPTHNQFVDDTLSHLCTEVIDAKVFYRVSAAKAGRTRFYNYREYWDAQVNSTPITDVSIKKIAIGQVHMEEVTV